MSNLRRRREALGLTQGTLASRAGVSRQLVGSVESGRHLPRVDAALALATALGCEVGDLFTSRVEPAVFDARSGREPDEGSIVRLGRVGDRFISAPVRTSVAGFEPGDALVEADGIRHLTNLDPGFVVLGCEPGLVVLEQMLRERGVAAVSVSSSSAGAIDALSAGRAHAAVVHGPVGDLPVPPVPVERYRLTSWQVGLAAPPDAAEEWWLDALHRDVVVIQRERGAGVQRTFESARTAGGPPDGPIVGSHLEAARRSVITGNPSVTIEPAALAVGAAFHPLDTHQAELWVDARWAGSDEVESAMAVIGDVRFARRLTSVGGYDLAGSGSRVA